MQLHQFHLNRSHLVILADPALMLQDHGSIAACCAARCSCLHGQDGDGVVLACCSCSGPPSGKKRKQNKTKQKTTPFGVKLMRSQALHRAAHAPSGLDVPSQHDSGCSHMQMLVTQLLISQHHLQNLPIQHCVQKEWGPYWLYIGPLCRLQGHTPALM